MTYSLIVPKKIYNMAYLHIQREQRFSKWDPFGRGISITRNLLEIQILGLHPRPPRSAVLSVLTSPPEDSAAH